MPPGSQALLFAAGVAVSLTASWLLVSRLERLAERAGFSEGWLGLVAALAEAIRPRRGTWRDGLEAAAALAAVVAASTAMEQTATALGGRYGVADIVTGGLVLAVVTRPARRDRRSDPSHRRNRVSARL